MIFGKWWITTNHMTCKSNLTVNPHYTLTSVLRVTPVDVLPIKKRLRCVYTTPLLEISVRQQRAFNLNESTVRGIINTFPSASKIILSKKQNFPSAGRPLSYPEELEEQLIKWILALRDFNFSVSILALQEKAKNLIQPGNPEFKSRRGWIEKFFNRHKLSLRSRTSVSQKLPSQLESILTRFYADAAKFMRIGKYPLSLVGKMDETPAFFDMVPSKCIAAKGTKECVVRTSGGEKKHLTFVLSATGDGKMLPPMLIFKGKTDRTISDLNIPTGFIVKTQEKTWMDDDLMRVWVEDIWIKHILAECQKLGLENALLTFDGFATHLTDDVKSQLLEAKNRHPGNSSWLYLKVPTHRCLSKQTIQSRLTKMLGELYFKCCGNFP